MHVPAAMAPPNFWGRRIVHWYWRPQARFGAPETYCGIRVDEEAWDLDWLHESAVTCKACRALIRERMGRPIERPERREARA